MIALRCAIHADPLLRSCVFLILQLHDEIIVELPARLSSHVQQVVRSAMESVIPDASVPFTTNIKLGVELGNMQAVKDKTNEKEQQEEEEEEKEQQPHSIASAQPTDSLSAAPYAYTVDDAPLPTEESSTAPTDQQSHFELEFTDQTQQADQ